MVRATITRVLGNRRAETLLIGAIAAISSVGLLRQGEPKLPVSAAVATVVRVEHAPLAGFIAQAVEGGAAQRMASTGSQLDLPDLENPRVDSWIRKFTTSQRGSFATYLSRKDKYEDMISGKLAKRGMPQDLIYLAMIESGFNPTAKSPVKARGLWQFMSATAKEYGLAVGRTVDERTNPSRSTDAALAYLTSLHNRFGSWYLAAAAYNTGQGRVARIMKQETGRTKGTDADYYRISNHLPQETRDYVPKMIAAARIGNNPGKYGFATKGD